MPPPAIPDPRLFGTTPTPNIVEKAKAKIKDVTNN
jgi:Mn-containing catalase